MKLVRCPACGHDKLTTKHSTDSVTFRGVDLSVSGMVSSECDSCGYTFTTPEQHNANIAAIRSAQVEQGAAAKAAKGLLTGAQLRAAREKLGLTQKQAADLFGGGPVAFSKYESEEVAQSVAMDRLVRVMAHMGEFGLRQLCEAINKEPPKPQALVFLDASAHTTIVPTLFLTNTLGVQATAGMVVSEMLPSTSNVSVAVLGASHGELKH